MFFISRTTKEHPMSTTTLPTLQAVADQWITPILGEAAANTDTVAVAYDSTDWTMTPDGEGFALSAPEEQILELAEVYAR